MWHYCHLKKNVLWRHFSSPGILTIHMILWFSRLWPKNRPKFIGCIKRTGRVSSYKNWGPRREMTVTKILFSLRVIPLNVLYFLSFYHDMIMVMNWKWHRLQKLTPTNDNCVCRELFLLKYVGIITQKQFAFFSELFFSSFHSLISHCKISHNHFWLSWCVNKLCDF